MTLEDLSPYLWIAHTLLMVVGVAVALVRTRGFKGTLAWILAIVAFPFVGALA